MSLDGTTLTFVPYTLNGISPVATTTDISNCVKYNGNTSDTNLNGYDLETTGTLSAQYLNIPADNTKTENFIMYSISTNGNLSSVGGLITTDLTSGRSMYFTGGVVGAPNFQFTTLGTGGKVLATDGNSVMSTTISVGQLNYITALTSQAGGIGQQNTWTDVQIHSANVSTTGSARFIQPYNALAADISTVVNRATLDSAIAGLGAGILNLNNVWTGSNKFSNYVSTNGGFTTDLNGVIQTTLNSLGYGPGGFSTAGIVGAYTPPLGTITGPVSGVYTMTQTAQGRSVMRIPAFGVGTVLTTYYFQFNIRCSVGTATISVEQDNTLISPALYPLSTGYNIVRGSFNVNGTSNSPVFKIYTGVASWTADWDSFTLSTYSANIVNAPLFASKISTTTSIAMTTPGGTLTLTSGGSTTHVAGDNSYTKYGPSASYPGYTLAVGATPDVGSASIAQLIVTNGNVFLDASNGQSIYYGNYQTSRGGTGTHEFYGNVYDYGRLSAYGFVVNGGGTVVAGSIYSDVNWGMLFRGKVAGTSGDFVFQNSVGTERLRIGTTGDITTTAPKFIATGTIAGINGGSAFAIPNNYMSSGSLTIGDNTKNYGGGSSWNSNTAGLLFECLDNTEIAVHDAGARVASFMYYSGNTFTMGRDMGWGGSNLSMPGIVSITGALTFGYSRYLYSPETAGATYGSMCVKGTGRNGWQGYSIYNNANQQVSFMLQDATMNYGLYNATNSVWNFYVENSGNGDVRIANNANTRGFNTANNLTSNVIYNTTATTASNIGSWSGYGYTLLSNTQSPAGNSPCMGLGCNYSNTCQITCLQPAIAWMNLAIFNAQTTFTYYGVACGYTVPSGGANVSDVREKHCISDVNTKNSLKKIMAIKPKYYKRKYYDDGVDEKGEKKTPIPDHIKEQMCIGVMAQDLLETGILAPAVSVAPLKNENIVPTADDDGTRWGVNYGDISIHMIGAVQELKKQNDAQQKEIDELKELVRTLMDRVRP